MKELLIMAKSLGGGGSEVALIELINALPEEHYNVTLVLLDLDSEYAYRLKKRVNIVQLTFNSSFAKSLVSMYAFPAKVLKKLSVNYYIPYYDFIASRVTNVFEKTYDIAIDFYGYGSFVTAFLATKIQAKSCMAGFVLKNTLSDNGGVTRGICKMDEQNNLTEVVETKNIIKTADGAEADGVVVDVDSLVSMNMWGLTPEFLDVLEEGFKEFFEKEVPGNPLKAEYLIPIFIGELLNEGKMSVKVLKTNDTWYGMTYHEDAAAVKDSFKNMLEKGVYKADLFTDL